MCILAAIDYCVKKQQPNKQKQKPKYPNKT